MHVLPTTRSCFGCGRLNASGLKLQVETDGQIVQARFIPEADHAGFKGIVHGGILSTILDELMAWACGVQAKRFAFCAELTVRFVQPAQIGQELLASAELVSNRRQKLFELKSSIRQGENLIATGTGKYLALKDSEMQEALTDFDSDPATVWGMD